MHVVIAVDTKPSMGTIGCVILKEKSDRQF